MKDIKKFEAFGDIYPETGLDYDWKKEFLEIQELFYNIEENLPEESLTNFSAGWRSSMNNQMFPCHINKAGEIVGNDEMIDKTCGTHAKFLIRITIGPKFKTRNYSPFKTSNSESFFGENAQIVVDIISRLKYITKGLNEYSMGITFKDDLIYIYFLRNNNERKQI